MYDLMANDRNQIFNNFQSIPVFRAQLGMNFPEVNT